MYCNKCGKQIVDDSVFCSYCGIKVKQTVQEELPINIDKLIIEACKECIKKHLKLPLTVNFNKIEIKDRDSYGRIYLYAEIDSQNSFGAMMRANLHIVLQNVNKDGSYEATNDAVSKVSFFCTEDVIKSVNKWNKKI